ncbi:MAG: c-type cytochrome [Burkholderiales bacterium]|nr:c-type cytochrome [Nitrosomonas sp.]MCP5274442.1 c-type cytochrome [Burkholderiales bacterium]
MNKNILIVTIGLFLLLPQHLYAESIRYQDVAPIFNERCVLCHAGFAATNGLQMENYQNLLKGGQNGAVIIPGDADSSELYRRIKGTSQPRMPMTGPPFLSDDQIERIARWINEGAQDAAIGENQKGGTVPTVPGTIPALELAQEKSKRSGNVTYADVKSIFTLRCVKCHMPNGMMGLPPENYLLDNYQNTLNLQDRARVVPGNIEASELIRRIRGQSVPRMPLDGPPYLSAEETQLIEKWVEQGARSENGEVAATPVGAKVRLHGRLTARWQLDGKLPVKISS